MSSIQKISSRQFRPGNIGWLSPDGQVFVSNSTRIDTHSKIGQELLYQDLLDDKTLQYLKGLSGRKSPRSLKGRQKQTFRVTVAETIDDLLKKVSTPSSSIKVWISMLTAGWSRLLDGDNGLIIIECGIGSEDVVRDFLSKLNPEVFWECEVEDTELKWRWESSI